MNIVLASASQRRQELLHRITPNFKIIVSSFDEASVKFDGRIPEYVIELSTGKASQVAAMLQEQAVVIGVDTIVALDNRILGKPKDKEQAFDMLKSLSGRWHEVYSGITLATAQDGKIVTDYSCTKVKFSDLTDEEISEYLSKDEYLDKAGAYALQGYAGVFVEEIRGCYYNVVGLPLNKLKKMLQAFM